MSTEALEERSGRRQSIVLLSPLVIEVMSRNGIL
jgi:hypothetical protein